MGIKLKTFTIVLDRPQPVYRPGEVVNGQVVVFLEGQMNLSQLTICLKGEAECHWSESRTHTHRDSNGRSHNRSETVPVHSCHHCLELHYSPGSVYPTTLNPGQHNIGFNFQLPVGNLPSSFEGQYGHIRYNIEAHIHKTQFFSFDERINQSITIASPAFVPIQELSQITQNSNHKTIGFFSSQTVTMRCQMQRIGHNIGSTIPVNVFVDNQSKKAMTLKASLKQDVVFHAQGHTRKTSDKLVRAVGNAIQAHSQQNEVIPVLVPVTTPIVYNSCPIITIRYTIVVTLDIPGSFDLHCELPVIITNEQLPFDMS